MLERRLLPGRHNTSEFDHGGNTIALVRQPPELPASIRLAVLPDAGFAYLDNIGDTVSFIGSGWFDRRVRQSGTRQCKQE